MWCGVSVSHVFADLTEMSLFEVKADSSCEADVHVCLSDLYAK